MYMLIMVLDDSARLNEVLQAWVDSGVAGITIFESTGVNRVLQRHHAEPMFAGFSQIFGSGRVGHNTLFAVLDTLEQAAQTAAATEAVLGPLDEPDTAIIFLLPVVQTWGMPSGAFQSGEG